ncbi:Tetraspanin-32 [Heterocephalus glaber]|uniref:Tetraspanin-32 n=1 Tax=Heterocephalus glaber TaxID=10181 RepID=G5C2E9_HETGA|nr:Tetraspanin-32 [Heterocephalus glaber]
MRPGSRVRAAKCQMLATSFFVLLLGFSVATMEVLTYFGDHHFAIISQVSLERNPYDAVHRWAFYVGISLAGLLILGASLSTTAAVKEAQGLMAGGNEEKENARGFPYSTLRTVEALGFLCFVMVFCALLQVAYWRFRNPTQVEDAMLDTYDLVYDQAVRSPSSLQWQELAAIQDTFLCCGKRSPFGLVESPEADLCQGEEAAREVYSMLLSSFLWFAILSGCNLDRKGTYTVTPRGEDTYLAGSGPEVTNP